MSIELDADQNKVQVTKASSVSLMTASISAELGAASDAINRYRTRVAGLIENLGPNHEDLISAMYEAERALLSAERLLIRAEKIAR